MKKQKQVIEESMDEWKKAFHPRDSANKPMM